MFDGMFWFLVFPVLAAAALVYLVIFIIGAGTIRIAFSLANPVIKVTVIALGLMVLASPYLYQAAMDWRAGRKADAREANLANLERVSLAGRLPATFITVGDFRPELIRFIETNYPLRAHPAPENKRMAEAYRNYRRAELCNRRSPGKMLPGTQIPICKKLPASLQSAMGLTEPVLVFANGFNTSMREDNILAGKIYEIRLITPKEDLLVAYYEQRTVESKPWLFNPYSSGRRLDTKEPATRLETFIETAMQGASP
jgi:hypothetical protein